MISWINKKVICIKSECAKNKYAHLNITYPEVGKLYTVAAYTLYKGGTREIQAIRFREIRQKNKKILGREIHFPIDWFVFEDDPRYTPISNYYNHYH